MASRFEIWYDEYKTLEKEGLALKGSRRISHTKKLSAIMARLKTLQGRIRGYGTLHKVVEINFGEHKLYFVDIEAQDIPHLINLYAPQLNGMEFEVSELGLGKLLKK